MSETTIILVLSLLLNFVSWVDRPKPLPPLEEDKVQVHWMQEGEPAPFDGILLNDYTYKRMRERINQLER